jgi:hypothetical protein
MRLISPLILVFAVQIPLALASASKRAETPVPERLSGEMMPAPQKPSPAVPGQYLISFEASVDAAARAGLFQKWKVKELEKVGSTPLYLIEVSKDANVEKTLAGLRSAPGVRYVEANLTMQTFGP